MTGTPSEGSIKVKCPSCDRVRWMDPDSDALRCSCNRNTEAWVAITYAASDIGLVRKLAEGGPMISERGGHGYSTARFIVQMIKRPVVTAPNKARDGHADVRPIAYLPGQEREAATLFIEENEDYVASCIVDSQSVLKKSLDEYMWQLLVEQWMWTGREWPRRRQQN